VIYDLGSSGGTLVNGDRVSECLLQPGDVINLAGVQVIYGEDTLTPPAPPDAQDTPPLPNT
jgi:pSer/pThr/pTyr-binding forkhead associated (FHA) protein